ncbi:hypothetical protein RJT34_03560 [Clitoria ternatea]|uniref:Uncharacterized protein n=1 Tax=Clitoria ternatea TaxID=43366 RepID=A0AAN9KME4_CLITE
MADKSTRSETHEVVLNVTKDASKTWDESSDSNLSVPFWQKLVAETVGTYFLVFAGCASIVVNNNYENALTFPGVTIVWGLTVMVVVYTIGHVSGAHINPAVTIAFASIKRFPYKQVPAYVAAQLLGSTLATVTLKVIFSGKPNQFTGTIPSGSELQSFVVEFIITFFLMFVISGVATDDRAVGEMAGLAIGSTIVLNALIAGQVSGASMNPARSLGPALVHNKYIGIWIYLLAPIIGALGGAWFYNILRYREKPMLCKITKSVLFDESITSAQKSYTTPDHHSATFA